MIYVEHNYVVITSTNKVVGRAEATAIAIAIAIAIANRRAKILEEAKKQMALGNYIS